MQPHVVPTAAAVPAGAAPRVAVPARPVLGTAARRDALPVPRTAEEQAEERRPRRWWDRKRRGDAAIWRSSLAVLDACSDAVLGVDGDGAVVFANSAATVLLGAPREVLVGTRAAEVVPGLPDALAEVRRRVVDGLPVDPAGEALELSARTLGGAAIPVAAWSTPFTTPDGGFVVAVTLRDLRPQHDLDDLCLRLDVEARQARDAVHAVLKAVTDRVVVLTDPHGRITTVNRAAEKLLGYKRDELVGRPSTRLSGPADVAEVAAELGVADGVDPLLELARWGLPNRQDWDFVTKDGRRRPVSLSVTAIGEREDPAGFVCVASDRSIEWQAPGPARRPAAGGERLLLDLDDAATRVLRWGVGRGARPSA